MILKIPGVLSCATAVLAAETMVALHSMQSGPKRIALPEARAVYDLITGEKIADHARDFSLTIIAPETRVFYLAEPNP
jgi:hypothetical protein